MEEEAHILKKERLGLSLIAGFFILPVLLFSVFLFREIAAPTVLSQPKTLVIEPKTGFIEISNLLTKEGIISRPASFRIYVLFRGWAGNLKSGRYTFSDSVSVAAVAKRLFQGPGDVEVTLPEGYTIQEIARKIASLGLLEEGKLSEIAQKPELFSYPFLSREEIPSLEGFFFPDTYRFNDRMSPEDMVRKMLENFNQKVWLQLGREFAKEPDTFYSVLTVASMLEKETAVPEDRRVISGILWRRFEAHMPLQVDATVVYAWKQLNPSWKPKNHALSSADLKINSPYNTYRSRGLPPGPIANPGLDAIRAALEPADSPYWYYLSTKDGKTIFSRTLEEHNEAKAKYL